MHYKRFFVCFLLLTLLAPPCAGEAADFVMPDREALSEVTLYRVIDGDTVVFESNKILLTVRMIGINAPESGAPYAVNATEFLENCLQDTRVFIEKGEEQLDDYGRLLAYVWLDDGTLLNERALREGTAALCFFPPNLRYAAALTEAQTAALNGNVGMWAVYSETDRDDEPADVRYIGNVKSRVLHRSDCLSLPSEKNRVYFTSYEDAIRNGFHECQNCFR